MPKFIANIFAFATILSLSLASAKPILSCSQTPDPRVCNDSISIHHGNNQFDFRNSILSSTLEKAMHIHKLASTVNISSLDNRTRAAWIICLELCDYSIDLLNRSLLSFPMPIEDSQTWLSATMANQQTCQDGFTELNSHVPFLSTPFFSNNLSESISNSLFVNKAMDPLALSNSNRKFLKHGLPTWVSSTDPVLELDPRLATEADLVVAKDGSGRYTTVTEAVNAAKKLSTGTSRFVIHVKAGIYKENVVIPKKLTNLMIFGEGAATTIITASKNALDGTPTFRSATFFVAGDGFIAQDITFENTAGPQKHQAVALFSRSDKSIFYRCSIRGYQDTLYVHSQRQFYRDCDIFGTVDFIFGDAAAVLQNCNLYVRKPMTGQANTVTAQGRTSPSENTGISIHASRITASPELRPVQGSFKTYLGRPWQAYSTTVFMKCTLDGLISPAGWLEWRGKTAFSNLYYGEYMNIGPGAGTSLRVNWPGYHVMTVSEATDFTVGNFISGNSWISTTIPFNPNL